MPLWDVDGYEPWEEFLSPKFNLNNFSLFASSPSLFIQKN
jgi:hypothetical protein